MFAELTMHRSAIAFVFRENPALLRAENLRFYDRVTAAGVEIPVFSVRGPELVLERRAAPSSSGLDIRVGTFGPAQRLRLLVSHVVGNDPVQVTRESADIAWEAFQHVWGTKIGQPELVEVTLECVTPAPGGDSRSFLASKAAHVSTGALTRLGREFNGFGLRLVSAPMISYGDSPNPRPPLIGAEVEARIETHFADPSQVFIGCKATWPAMMIERSALPPEAQKAIQEAVLQVNEKAQPPTRYLTEVYEFIASNVLLFLREAAAS